MKIEKEDVIKLMHDTVNNNWLNPQMDMISPYETAITLISGFGDKSYKGQEEDMEKVMEHIHDYSDFKIENVYDIIYKHQPWNFMNR